MTRWPHRTGQVKSNFPAKCRLEAHRLNERSGHGIPSTSATIERQSLPNHCCLPILSFHSETSYTSQPIPDLFKLTPLRQADTVISAARPIFNITRRVILEQTILSPVFFAPLGQYHTARVIQSSAKPQRARWLAIDGIWSTTIRDELS